MCYDVFNDTAATEIYTLSLHDALPIARASPGTPGPRWCRPARTPPRPDAAPPGRRRPALAVARRPPWSRRRRPPRSEEYKSEVQSRQYFVCRLLLEKNYYLVNYQLHTT